MKLSDYKRVLDSNDLGNEELRSSIVKYLNTKSITYDSFEVVSLHPSFLVLKIVHNGVDQLTNTNIWTIIEDMSCKRCSGG